MSAPHAPIICIAGKSRLAVETLNHARERYGRECLLACPTRDDTGTDSEFLSLTKAANESDIPVVALDAVYHLSNLIFLSLEFDRIIKPSLFAGARLFNLHYSLLPAYKGCYPAVLPILEGRTSSGVTLHEIDAGIDTGPIIAQTEFPLAGLRAIDVYLRCQHEGLNLIKQNLDSLVTGSYVSQAQSATDSSYYPRNAIDFQAWPIQFHATAAQIARQFHARYFPHFQRPTFSGIAIANCIISSERSLKSPGTIISQNEQSIRIATVDYDLLLYIDTLTNQEGQHGRSFEPL